MLSIASQNVGVWPTTAAQEVISLWSNNNDPVRDIFCRTLKDWSQQPEELVARPKFHGKSISKVKIYLACRSSGALAKARFLPRRRTC